MTYHGYVAIQGRGTMALPAELRRRYRLDEPGAQIELTERADGVIELRPALPVPVDQMWFFTPGHQAAEREAEADIRHGRYRDHDSAADLLAALESISGEETPGR
ncbi:AbrB/MazE/SpoVT family DNA-binding domain-containing protein [Streptomyces polyrhachis]|uniref:AbrB/MazE/SpoVT family DNA-binding domain-containing protein n=1 Tax=Streptomyces polyrhachis TaxID=1282885 RepID=A0ABW2GDS6_9ACTN